MEKEIKNSSNESSIQDYLSMGYLYLLALGIFREVIYYGFLDVNILSYSNVMDVLLSPLVFLSKDLKVTGILIGFGIALYFLSKYTHKKKQKETVEASDETPLPKPDFIKGTIFLIGIGFLAFFLGTGIGSGVKQSRKLKNGDFENTHQIIFSDTEEVNVKLIGSNSQFVFYVLENEKQVSISPIEGNVKKIQRLESKD